MTLDAFLSNLCEHCGLDPQSFSIEMDEQEDKITITLKLPEEESGLFIGFHGETLESMQRLLRVIFYDQYPDKKIMLNINEYREGREERLRDMTQNIAEKVLQTGKEYTFNSYLPASERFIIHTQLAEVDGADQLTSYSSGEGKNRRLSIAKK